jgi:TonB-dependent SusC/RagA subfamily outer membrane receptor
MSRHRTAFPPRAVLAVLPLVLAAACASSKREAGGQQPAARAADSTRTPTGSAGAGPQGVATSKEWQGRGATRVEELFAGRFAGVQVYEASGGFVVRIRGGSSSINGSNDPLYIVDGFPYTPGAGGLVTLNPSDISKIEVLKDATSLAEYGVRGANGVVRITTKRGK